VPVLVFVYCNPDQPHHRFAVWADRSFCQPVWKSDCVKRHHGYLATLRLGMHLLCSRIAGPPGNNASGPLTELDHARSELCPVSGAVPPIGSLVSVGPLVSVACITIISVACITIVGSITVIGVVVVSARRSCSYCNGANANRRSAINSTVGISSAINSTAGNASVMHSYTSVMHSYTSASTRRCRLKLLEGQQPI
jgi:hypothetical protein